jgi:hypothetical protein
MSLAASQRLMSVKLVEVQAPKNMISNKTTQEFLHPVFNRDFVFRLPKGIDKPSNSVEFEEET